jgi:cytoskeletal protein RodZ
MPTVGEQLRSARERLELTVHQAADATKIKTDHIRALEEGRWGVFGVPVYIRGFTRNYASHLKLDVPRIMAELDAELAASGEFEEVHSLTGRKRTALDILMLQLSRVKWQIVFPILAGILGVLLIVWGVRSWRARSAKDPLSELGNGLYQAPQRGGADVLPLPTNAPSPQAGPGRRTPP